jgi:hypothetical protein
MANDTSSTGTAVDDELMAHTLGHFLGDEPTHDFDCPTAAQR